MFALNMHSEGLYNVYNGKLAYLSTRLERF